jgi:hypothetical protein
MISGGPGTQAVWGDLHADKLGWAYRAYGRFIGELSEDVRAHLTHGAADQEPYVVVFGRTQVGKTTLILELMGLEADAQDRVGRVLRGGREFGKSATATTMEYRRSPDCDWYLDDGESRRRIVSDDEMCEALGELRLRMSERRLRAEKPVVVSIPENCFAHGREGGVGTRMLDLPGDSPADEVEREHVERMAKRYVPHADLILLVGRGDDLSFLNPAALTLPSIEDWQFVPNRFRIVTTFSFTPDTVQKFARDHEGELRPEHFRARLLKQIGTFGRPLSPEADNPERFFPLEFGRSWQTMLVDDNEFSGRVEPAVNQLKAQLHADIRASATEAARFRNALDVNFVAKRRRAARVEQGEARLAELGRRAASVEALAMQADQVKQAAARQFDATQALLRLHDEAAEELSSAFAFDATDQIAIVNALATNTSALFGRINDFTSWLRQQFLETVPSGSKARKFLGNSRPDLRSSLAKVNSIADDEFATLRVRMNGYWRQEYYPSVSESFATDKRRLKDDMGDAAAKTAKLAQKLWRKQIGKRMGELNEQAAEADGERFGMQQIAQQKRAELNELDVQRGDAEAEMDRAVTQLDKDLATAARFAEMLDEEYLSELRQRRAQVATSGAADALLILLSVVGLAEERQKIKLT